MNARKHTPRTGRTWCPPTLILTATCIGLAGCGQSPLFRSDADYDRQVSLARLSKVEGLDLSGSVVSDPEELVDSAQDPTPAQELRASFETGEPVELTLERARAAALENNLDLRVTLINPVTAEERVNEEEGRFEALIFANAQAADTDNPVAFATESSQERRYFLQPGVRVPLRTGGQIELTAPTSRSRNDNPFQTLNPAYSANVQLSVSHNLLRGAGRRANTFQIRIADIDRQQSVARTRLEVVRQLAAAERAYWRLYAQRQALDVRYQQYDAAVEQLQRARRRFNAGQEPEIEVVRAESGVADRIEAIIIAENEVLLRERELKRIINIPGLGVDGDAAIITITDPDPVQYRLDGSDLADRAMDRRMELLELELRLAADAATIAFRENQALPLLAMSYSYRVAGLDSSSSTAWRQVGDNEFQSWELGLNAEIPLGNETRESAIEQAVLGRFQTLATRDARRLAIRKEVLDAVDAIETGWQRILAARQSVLLSGRTLEAEQRQFDVGRSTSTDVLDADARLADARLAEIRALAEYEVAQIDLAFATGTLLGASRVEWGPFDPRETDTYPDVDEDPKPTRQPEDAWAGDERTGVETGAETGENANEPHEAPGSSPGDEG